MQIIGQIVNVIFHNPENNYKVLAVETENELVTIQGYFDELVEDLDYVFTVIEKQHAVYGMQYEAQAYQLKLPSEVEAIEHFLASGIIAGIGAGFAEKIVAKFGVESLNIIRNNPERLKEIAGIGKETYKKIVHSFNEQLEREEIYFFLSGLEFSPKMSRKIYDCLGEATIEKVKENPYQLLGEIQGLGFKKLDQIAMRLGFKADSPYRQEAVVLQVLHNFSSQGHIYVPRAEFLNDFKNYIAKTEDEIENLLDEMVVKGSVVYQKTKGDRIYLKALHQLELDILRNIIRLASAPLENLSLSSVGSELELTAEQQQAVDKGLNEAIYILTGGPGTGKTTVLKEWVRRLEKLDKTYALCAPTGRAASRMEAVIGRSASTIHRLLEFQYEGELDRLYFKRCQNNPLDADFVFVDETSMLDAPLFNALLNALKTGTRLILIGDVNQLPAVGVGAILEDLLSSTIARSELKQIHRQAADSLILKNAHALLNGQSISMNKKTGDFYFVRQNNNAKIIEQLKRITKERLPNYYGVEAKEITVLTPIRAGFLGCENLNKELQAALNFSREKFFKRFSIGDKVMQNKNNYSLEWVTKTTREKGQGIFNGEIGTVTAFSDGKLYVDFSDGKSAAYNFNEALDLTLAYALTIHKSQGNEFDYVVLVLPNVPPLLRSRNLLYTAITRAKRHLTVIGDVYSFNQLALAEQNQKRYSSLDERLNEVLCE